MRPLRNSPAASRLPQTVLADPSALRCDARRSRREPVRGGVSDIWLRPVLFFVGCNQRASALHRMSGLSQTSGAMRCASIAPYLTFRRSDFSPTAALTRHRVGLKSDLQELCWSRVGNTLPTHGGQLAAHPTQARLTLLRLHYLGQCPVESAEHRRLKRGSRRGLFESQTAGLGRVPQPPFQTKSQVLGALALRTGFLPCGGSAGCPSAWRLCRLAKGANVGSPSLGYVSWRDKKGNVPAGHPRHPITRVSAQNTMARQA